MRLYFDYAASTPIDKRVVAAMRPYFVSKFGNPSSLHIFGQEALAAVDKTREVITQSLGVNFRDIIFTGSATEANNLILRGVVKRWRSLKRRNIAPKIIVSSIEHESVLETVRSFSDEEAEVFYLPVDREGYVDVDVLRRELDDRTMLVSVMYANNEIGTIEPIQKIAQVIQDFRKNGALPLFHTDASQAFQYLSCDVRRLGVDTLTISGHKIYGPKGIGALYIREDIAQVLISPIITGGGQEFGLRAGTENVPLVAGLGKAVALVGENRSRAVRDVGLLRHALWNGIRSILPSAELIGPRDSSGSLPSILHIRFPGIAAEELLTQFDRLGLSVSSGSACSSRLSTPSHVLQAIGRSVTEAKEGIRFSLGFPTTKGQIDRALRIIKIVLKKYDP